MRCRCDGTMRDIAVASSYLAILFIGCRAVASSQFDSALNRPKDGEGYER